MLLLFTADLLNFDIERWECIIRCLAIYQSLEKQYSSIKWTKGGYLLAVEGQSLGSSIMHEDVISGDTPEPGAEGPGLIEAIKGPPRGHHGLLVDVIDR